VSLTERIVERVETKTRKSERTRERIVSAAAQLVLERRGADFQMAEVAAACGMTKGALYYYFRDRTALVEEVFDRAANEFVGRIESIAGSGLPPRETLEELCGAFAEEVEESDMTAPYQADTDTPVFKQPGLIPLTELAEILTTLML